MVFEDQLNTALFLLSAMDEDEVCSGFYSSDIPKHNDSRFFEMLLTLKAGMKSFSIGVVHSEEIPWQVGTLQ